MKPHCQAPWTVLHILPDGNLKPCPVYQGEMGSLKDTNLQPVPEAWRALRKELQTHLPPNCDKCIREEKINQRSIRTSATALVEESGANIDHALDAPFNLLDLDISFSNQCNLSCRFCSSKYSSKWTSESRFMESQGFDFSDYPDMLDRHSFSMDVNEALKLANTSPHLSQVLLKGGEPLMHAQTYELLHSLKSQGRDKDLTISIVTNMTFFRPELKELLSGFKTIDMNISAEATGAAYQYIRGGKFQLEKEVQSNLYILDGLPQLKWTFHSVLSAYNIFEPIKFYRWMQSLGLKSRHKWQFGFLNHPSFLRPGVLPERLLQEALAANQDLPKEKWDVLQNHYLWHKKANGETKNLFEKLQHFTRLSDEFRKMSIEDCIPELAQTLKSADFAGAMLESTTSGIKRS